MISSGIPIRVHPMMEGSKTAILSDGVIYVSPAMHVLIKDANENGTLTNFLSKLPLLNLDGIAETMNVDAPLPLDVINYGPL